MEQENQRKAGDAPLGMKGGGVKVGRPERSGMHQPSDLRKQMKNKSFQILRVCVFFCVGRQLHMVLIVPVCASRYTGTTMLFTTPPLICYYY